MKRKKECNLLLQNQEKMLLERQLVLLEALARSMCHEFNNVLGGILGYGQLALRSPGDANIAERALNVAVRGARRGSELVSRMSQFAHYQVDTPGRLMTPFAWCRIASKYYVQRWSITRLLLIVNAP